MESDTTQEVIRYYIQDLKNSRVFAITNDYSDFIRGYDIDNKQIFTKSKKYIMKSILEGKYDLTKDINI